MYENVYDLPNYKEYSSKRVYNTINGEHTSSYAVMYDKFGKVYIPSSRNKEFSEILTREIREKFDKNAKNAGMITAVFNSSYSSDSSDIPILECYTDTIAFVESLREYDGEEEAFSISASDKNFYASVSVKIKDADGAEEKELFSLLEPETNEHYFSGAGSGVGTWFYIESSNNIKYYIPEENKERVLDLMLTIIEKIFSQKTS